MSAAAWRYIVVFGVSLSVTVGVLYVFGGQTYSQPSTIIVIGMESTRADHIGPCYGYDRVTAPNVCGIADDGVLFEQAYAQGSWTLVSLSSFFTARTPLEVGGGGWETVQYSDGLVTFPEILAGEGYTLQHPGGIMAFQEIGMLQGFNDTTPGDRFLVSEERNRFYLMFLNDYAHIPYTPAEGFQLWGNSSSGQQYTGDTIREWRAFVNRTPRQTIIDLYDGEIREGDQRIGSFLERLREARMYEDALIVFFADHGEAFGEHGLMADHGGVPYEEVVRVPLIIKFPGNRFAGTRVSEPVSLVDVPHTLFDYLDIDTSFGSIGSSLLPLIRMADVFGRGFPGYTPSVIAAEDPLDAWMIRKGTYTLFLSPIDDTCREDAPPLTDVLNATGGPQDDGVPVRLYDLSTDPLQQENIAAERPGTVRRLGADLCRVFNERERNPDWFTEKQLSGELQDRLRALGYLE